MLAEPSRNAETSGNRPSGRSRDAHPGGTRSTGRKQNRKAHKNARFRYDASIEQVLFDSARGRDQGRIMQLASCEYLRQGASVLITGPAGVGKSYISTALGYQACLSGFRVRYFNMNKLLEAIQMSRIETKAAKFFDRMAEVDLLIIEDFGMKVLDGQQLMDFMELIEDRHARKSTIITSQLPVKNWYDILAKNTTVAEPCSTDSQKRLIESSCLVIV